MQWFKLRDPALKPGEAFEGPTVIRFLEPGQPRSFHFRPCERCCSYVTSADHDCEEAI